jgi:hypothetical protein
MLLMEIPVVLDMMNSEMVVIACDFTGWESLGEREQRGTEKGRSL